MTAETRSAYASTNIDPSQGPTAADDTTQVPEMTDRTAALVTAVKAHAADNYEAGWDVVVETMTDEDIAERIGAARTPKGAIAKVAELVAVQVGRMIDVLSQSGEHDAEVAALVAATKPRRGPAKTGHPVVDRKVNAAKAAKATAKKGETETATPTPTAKKPAAKKPTRVLEPVTATIQAEVPAGYVPRYTHKSYDLYSTAPGEGKIQWLVVCNAHRTHTTASGGREGDVLGSKAGRQGWCTKCAAEAKTTEGKTTEGKTTEGKTTE